jgi:uncharacterized protein (DUF1501 family)
MPNNTARNLSRRSLIDLGAKTATALGLSHLFGPISSAASPDRACVCVYLLGGNDSNNMVVPLDSASFESYAKGRGRLALAQSSLLPVRARAIPGNYGFHPALAGLQDLYNGGRVAVVANVGRADRPLVKGRFDPRELPGDLFLHTGASQVRYLPGGRLAMAWEPEAADAAARDRLADNPGNLSQRLARVAAELTRSGSTTAFTVALSGFDTHAGELARQESLFAELNDGLVSFYRQLQSLGIADRVTVFTATEFNRTLAPNAKGGADHGWGGHNLVLGGGVYGADIVGRFPSMELGGPDDLGTSGVWIPSISDQQYSYTIARWYGVSDLSAPFPGLRNFPRPDADFLAFH